MLFSNNYKGNHSFPNDDIDPKQKLLAKFNLDWAKAIYGLYCNNRAAIGIDDHKRFAELTRYSEGRQSTDRYRNILSPPTNSDKAGHSQADIESGAVNPHDNGTNIGRNGFSSIDYSQTLDIGNNYRHAVVSRYFDRSHDVSVNAIDEMSIQSKENKKWSLWVDKELGPLQNEVNASLGLPPEPQSQYVPETEEELEFWKEIGGFKLKEEIAMEKAINSVFVDSNQDQIKLKCLTDVYVKNCCATQDYTCRKTGKVKSRYVDVEKFIASYDSSGVYDRLYFAGELREVSLVEVLPHLDEITRGEVSSLASTYNGQLGNNFESFDDSSSQVSADVSYVSERFPNLKILIFDAEKLSTDTKYTSKKKTKSGKLIVDDLEYSKKDKPSNNEIITTSIDRYYRAKWIVGTDIVYDYGLQYDVPRSNDLKTALSSYHFYQVEGKSKQEVMIPIIDQIQLAWYRFQNAVAKSRPAGLAIDVKALQNITIGKKKLHPLEIVKISRQDGTLLYSSTTARGHMPQASRSLPYSELKGGMGDALQEFIGTMEYQMGLIADLTGVPRLSVGGDQNSQQGLGLARISEQSSQISTSNIYQAYLEMKKGLATNICRRLQLWVMSRQSAYKVYSKTIGKAATEVLKIQGEEGSMEFGIYIVPRASQEEKDRILQMAVESMRANKSGMPGIKPSDLLMLQRVIDQGQIRHAEALLGYKEQKAAEQYQASKDQSMKVQSDGNIQLQKETSASDIEKEKIKSANKIAEIKAKGEEDRKLKQMDLQFQAMSTNKE